MPVFTSAVIFEIGAQTPSQTREIKEEKKTLVSFSPEPINYVLGLVVGL